MATPMQPEGYETSWSRMELSLSCAGLVDMDVFSKSDPMCVLFVKKSGNWIEHGRTETIQDNLNPKVWKVKRRHIT